MAFPAHCPTRFGVLLELAVAVLQNKEPIRKACDDDSWEVITTGAANADRFYQLAFGHGSKKMWQRLELVVALLQPVVDCIHQVEADQPMLSQVVPMWRLLTRHFVAWHAKLADEQLKVDNVPAVLRERKEKSVPPAAFAAYLLDPLNYMEEADGDNSKWRAPFTLLTTSERESVKRLLKRMAGTGNDQKVLKELSAYKLTTFSGTQAEDLPFITSKVNSFFAVNPTQIATSVLAGLVMPVVVTSTMFLLHMAGGWQVLLLVVAASDQHAIFCG